MHLISSYCKLQAIDNARLSLNFTSVLSFLPCCWVGGSAAPGSVRNRVGPPTSGWIPPGKCVHSESANHVTVWLLCTGERGVQARAFVLMKYSWSWPYLENKPLPPSSCVQPWSLAFWGAEKWESGSEERVLGWLQDSCRGKRCQLISSLFRLKGWWIFFPGYC